MIFYIFLYARFMPFAYLCFHVCYMLMLLLEAFLLF